MVLKKFEVPMMPVETQERVLGASNNNPGLISLCNTKHTMDEYNAQIQVHVLRYWAEIQNNLAFPDTIHNKLTRCLFLAI